jgi:hypothetical protein
VTTWADNVLLRSNPGYLFPQITALKQGTALTVIGRSPGGEWLLVQASDARSGWVFAQLVEAQGGVLTTVPFVQPADVLVVRGRVSDVHGAPVSGIQFTITQGSGSNVPRTDALTDETGMFYAFMPQTASGRWWVAYTAIACTSNIMDANCNWVGLPSPEGVFIEIPQSSETVLEFGWR